MDADALHDPRTTSALPRVPTPPRPAQWVRLRFRAWAQSRQGATDTLTLTQRNVYILPTRAGFMFALTLLVLLLASVNYQLNLGYVLTFLLAGSGAVSLHSTHRTLRGLTLHVRPVAPGFAGDSARLECVLTSPDRARFGIGLQVLSAPADQVSWANVPAGGQASTNVSFVPERRGLHPLPALSVETRFPLGLFRAWTVWRPASRLLVYPRPEHPACPLPPTRSVPGGSAELRRGDSGETEGVRGYRRGDPLKLVLWKKAAKAMESGGELVSRDTSAAAHHQLELDWLHCAGLADEQRLSRLAAWILTAHRAGVEYALRLPGTLIPAAATESHRRRCLEALALWR
jgi:uncharacterized protein (DUF58 family)